MKSLFITLISIPVLCWGTGTAHQEMPALTGLDSKFVSVVKNIQNQNSIENSKELKTCRDSHKIPDGADPVARDRVVQAIMVCFTTAVGDNPARLKQLSDSFELESYGLVKSKASKDVTDYLSKNLRKVLTGVHPDDESKNLAFSKKNIVDQKVYLQLYATQLTKNALFEVSRYCFENFRREGKVVDKNAGFQAYWDNFFTGTPPELSSTESFGDYTDTGTGSEFGDFSSVDDPNKKENIYPKIVSSITGDKKLNSAPLKQFFAFCQKSIPKLCEGYLQKTVETKAQKGAQACLVKSRLQEIYKADGDTKKFIEHFKSYQGAKTAVQIKDAKFFELGGTDETSLDNLTNHSSSDFVGNTKKDDLVEKCAKEAEDPNCERFYSQGDDYKKAAENAEIEMSLKKTIEIEKIKKMKDQDLQTYLSTNGYVSLIKEMEDLKKENKPPLTNDMIQDRIRAEFDKRKVATLQVLQDTVGKRQATNGEKANANDLKTKEKDSAKDAKEEHARLAQVVMFNNIITSQLELQKVDANGVRTSLGTNVNAFNKEDKGLSMITTVKSELFTNLKTSTGNGHSTQKDNLDAAAFINSVLGKNP